MGNNAEEDGRNAETVEIKSMAQKRGNKTLKVSENGGDGSEEVEKEIKTQYPAKASTD